eukprot:223124_1
MSAFILLITLHIQVILCTEYKNGDVSSPFTFYLDDHILSHDGLVQLSMQNNGNLAMSDGVWATDTDPNGDHVKLQEDGTLVVFDATGGILWQSNSITGTSPFRLVVTDDVEIYILDSVNTIVWSTNPSFASLQTIWTETFDSNDKASYYMGMVTFASSSTHCPNYPDYCVKVQWNDPDDGWVGISTDDISMYSTILFQVDITGFDLESAQYDACKIYYLMNGIDWTEYDTVYPTGVYKDVIINIPLTNSYKDMHIDLQISADEQNDKCFFDNAILRGILIQSPTTQPTHNTFDTGNPTKSATDIPTYKPTSTHSNNPSVSPTYHPSFSTKNPAYSTRNPSINPSVSPTNNPVLRTSHYEPSKSIVTTSSGLADTTDSVGNVMRDNKDSNAIETMKILMVIVSILIVCVAMALLGVFWVSKRNERKRAKVEIQSIASRSMDVQRMEPRNVMRHSAPLPVADGLEICDEMEQSDVDNKDTETLGGNVDLLGTLTQNGGLNIAPDEFVVGGDDEEVPAQGNKDVGQVITAGEGLEGS